MPNCLDRQRSNAHTKPIGRRGDWGRRDCDAAVLEQCDHGALCTGRSHPESSARQWQRQPLGCVELQSRSQADRQSWVLSAQRKVVVIKRWALVDTSINKWVQVSLYGNLLVSISRRLSVIRLVLLPLPYASSIYPRIACADRLSGRLRQPGEKSVPAGRRGATAP